MRHRVAGFALAWAAACGSLAACSSGKGEGTTGPSSSSPEPVNIPFSRQERWCAGFVPNALNVTQLLGPPGSTTANPLPGTWIVRGTYNLPSTSYANVTIEASFLGSVVTAQNGQSVPQLPFTVPAGQRSGSFEARGGFLSRTSGPGTPGALMSSGSSALDCVAVY
jgi:hypothetical protein